MPEEERFDGERKLQTTGDARSESGEQGRKLTLVISPNLEQIIRLYYPEGEWTLQKAVQGMLWRGIAASQEAKEPLEPQGDELGLSADEEEALERMWARRGGTF